MVFIILLEGKPIHQKYKANEKTIKHKTKQKQTVNKKIR